MGVEASIRAGDIVRIAAGHTVLTVVEVLGDVACCSRWPSAGRDSAMYVPTEMLVRLGSVAYASCNNQKGSPMFEKSNPDVSIRPAASAIILRNGPDGLEVFLVVRHHQIDFASGATVFPGGSVDPQDAAPFHFGVHDPRPHFWIACLRETFEEAGILLARERATHRLVDPSTAAAIVDRSRQAVVDGTITFLDMLQELALMPATDLLVPFAHWVTPAGPPRRFDTHFFLVQTPVSQIGLHDGHEAVEGAWITPSQALADADKGVRTMLPPTRLNLEKLCLDRTVEDAVTRARAQTVVTVEPQVERTKDGVILKIPKEAGYGRTEILVKR